MRGVITGVVLCAIAGCRATSHRPPVPATAPAPARSTQQAVTSLDEAMERIRVAPIYARPGTWIVVAGGWTPAQFAERRRPTQAELVAAAPDHPVYV